MDTNSIRIDYPILAQRTAPPITPEVVNRMKAPPVLADLARILHSLSGVCESLSRIKSYVFYGKSNYVGIAPEMRKTDNAATQIRDDWEVKLLHGLLGSISESGELAHMIYMWLYEGQQIDIPNLVEELGDHEWFAEEALAALNEGGIPITMEAVKITNIAKLFQRFGSKFDADRATMRDLEGERSVIEAAISRRPIVDDIKE